MFLEVEQDQRTINHRVTLLSSLLTFTKVMFKLRTGRDFIISKPVGAESHFISCSRALTKVFLLQTQNLLINMPPGYGKSELCKHFIAWSLARYPDSNFLYISFNADLATKHTAGIKEIVELPEYQRLFDVRISSTTNAKDYFKTNSGGVVAAFGSAGGITGHDAGLPGLDRFSGAVIIDDAHKPDKAHSELDRDKVIKNYQETIRMRRRGQNVPILFIGQRVHEADLAAYLLSGSDGDNWEHLIIKDRQETGMPRYPEYHSLQWLDNEEKHNNYVYHAQCQQNPIPPQGGIFKKDDFVLLHEEPKILKTFITADTAETEKTYNDASVFSFWGIYKIEDYGHETDLWGLHWIDCLEFRAQPHELEAYFAMFYSRCLQYPVKPLCAAIEAKSAGTTLISLLQKNRGLKIVDILRTGASSSKIDRYLSVSPIVSNKLISLPVRGDHTTMCLHHMSQITANGAHAHDDIADTFYDAVDIALVKKLLLADLNKTDRYHSTVGIPIKQIADLRSKRYGAIAR